MSGRRAIVPHSSVVSEQLPDGALSVMVRNEAGTSTRCVSFAKDPGPIQMRRELVQSLALLNGPDGPWRSPVTCARARDNALRLLLFAEGHGIHSLAELTPELWTSFVASVRGSTQKTQRKNMLIGQVRRFILFSPATPARTRLKAAERYFEQPREDVAPRQFHTQEEFDLIKTAATRELRRAAARVSSAYRLVEADIDAGDSAKTTPRRAAMESFLAGAYPYVVRNEKGRVTSEYQSPAAALGRQAAADLTPTISEIFAALIALICVNGDNLSTAQNRVVPTSGSSTADEGITVLSSHLDKPRRGHRRHMPEHVDRTSAKGEVLAMIIELTEPARMRAAVVQPEMRNSLFLWWSKAKLRTDLARSSTSHMRTASPWAQELPHFTTMSLHRTYITRVSQRAHHQTPETRADAYLRRDPLVVARWEAIAREGIDRVFNEAQASTELLVARSKEELHSRAEREDLVTPSGMVCRNPRDHPTSRRVCRDPFLACLGCANAYAYDDHIPILVYLYRRLEQERSGGDGATWKARFLVPWAQLTAILRDLPAEEWRSAELALPDAAKQLVERAVFERGWDS